MAVPESWLNRLMPFAEDATFTISGRNVWRWVNEDWPVFDPEMTNNNDNNPLSRDGTDDGAFLESVDTFRPISNRELVGQSPKKIHYVKATSATTFEALGQHLKLDQNEVDDLRLINGYWPSGEPKPGEWIKIFVQ